MSQLTKATRKSLHNDISKSKYVMQTVSAFFDKHAHINWAYYQRDKMTKALTVFIRESRAIPPSSFNIECWHLMWDLYATHKNIELPNWVAINAMREAFLSTKKVYNDIAAEVRHMEKGTKLPQFNREDMHVRAAGITPQGHASLDKRIAYLEALNHVRDALNAEAPNKQPIPPWGDAGLQAPPRTNQTPEGEQKNVTFTPEMRASIVKAYDSLPPGRARAIKNWFTKNSATVWSCKEAFSKSSSSAYQIVYDVNEYANLGFDIGDPCEEMLLCAFQLHAIYRGLIFNCEKVINDWVPTILSDRHAYDRLCKHVTRGTTGYIDTSLIIEACDQRFSNSCERRAAVCFARLHVERALKEEKAPRQVKKNPSLQFTHPQKEQIMAKPFETIDFVFGTQLKDCTADQLMDAIRKVRKECAELKELEDTGSKHIEKRIKELTEAEKKIVKALDAK